MSIERLMKEPVTVIHRAPTGSDDYGNQLYVESDRLDTVGHLRMVHEIERLNEQETAISTEELYLPAGTPVTEFDQILINNEIYDIFQVGRAVNPRTAVEHHVLLKLTGVKG